MFVHIFGFRWRPEATDTQKERAKEAILAFRGAIPGLIDVHVGENISPRGLGYTFVGLMTFRTRLLRTPIRFIRSIRRCWTGW